MRSLNGPMKASTSIDTALPQDSTTDYVTAMVGGQLFGLPIAGVRDVFIPGRMTRIPLASCYVAGVLNLRGRIVTAIDMHARLGFAGERSNTAIAIGVDQRGESYGLLVDTVGEVLRLNDTDRDETPVNLDAKLAHLASGIYRLTNGLMVVLEADRVLELEGGVAAAA